jgi:hypothetical protein
LRDLTNPPAIVRQAEDQELASLARDINEAHEARLTSFRTSLEQARRAGELLARAKARVGHGAWRRWLKSHCRFKERTAQNYMRVEKHWDELVANTQATADLTMEAALRKLGPAGREDQAPEEPGAATPGGGLEPNTQATADLTLEAADAPAPHATADATPAGEPVVATCEPGADPAATAGSIDATPADRPPAAAEQEAAPQEVPVPAAVPPRSDRDEITVDIRASREEFPRALAEALLQQLRWGRAYSVIQEVLDYFYDVDPNMCGSAQDG